VLAFAFALGGEFAEKSQDSKSKKFKILKPSVVTDMKSSPLPGCGKTSL
jgi:hypothetical protein